MESGYVIVYGPYIYCEMNKEHKRPVFTYNWTQARVYEDYDEAEQIRQWLQNWDGRNTYRMKDWTKIISNFQIKRIKVNPQMKNLREKKTENEKVKKNV